MENISSDFNRIFRAVRKMRDRESQASGLGRGEMRTLHFISHHPGTTQQEICGRFGINKAATARQCAALEEKGLIYRTDNKNDGRSKLLFPTEHAQMLKSEADLNAEHAYEMLLAGFTDAEKEELARMIRKMCGNIPRNKGDRT